MSKPKLSEAEGAFMDVTKLLIEAFAERDRLRDRVEELEKLVASVAGQECYWTTVGHPPCEKAPKYPCLACQARRLMEKKP